MQPWVRDPLFDVATSTFWVAESLQKHLKIFQLFSQKGKIQKESMSPYTRPFSSSDILEGITNNFDQQENKW